MGPTPSASAKKTMMGEYVAWLTATAITGIEKTNK